LGGERVTFFGLLFSGNPNIHGAFHLTPPFCAFRVSARLDRQEKKRALLEVIQKIKVNSSNEVHLSVNLPQNFPLPYKAKGFGEILLNGALRMKNTRKAVFQISYPIKDYYNNNGSSMK
jgi:hypothetical protein